MSGRPEKLSDGQVWDAERYAGEATFVHAMGSDLLAVLAPQLGEKILDVGCGEGSVTAQIAQAGAVVVGVDSSESQIELAQSRGLDAHVMNACEVPFDAEFDAVYSNATFHWIADFPILVQRLHQVLKPGGRLVVEFGGAGNIAAILHALQTMFAKHGLVAEQFQPWHFRTPETWQTALQTHGFQAIQTWHYPRPTPVKHGIRSWLELMAGDYFNPQPASRRERLLDDVVEALQPTLYHPPEHAQPGWWVDYVRLRVTAVKCADG